MCLQPQCHHSGLQWSIPLPGEPSNELALHPKPHPQLSGWKHTNTCYLLLPFYLQPFAEHISQMLQVAGHVYYGCFKFIKHRHELRPQVCRLRIWNNGPIRVSCPIPLFHTDGIGPTSLHCRINVPFQCTIPLRFPSVPLWMYLVQWTLSVCHINVLYSPSVLASHPRCNVPNVLYKPIKT